MYLKCLIRSSVIWLIYLLLVFGGTQAVAEQSDGGKSGDATPLQRMIDEMAASSGLRQAQVSVLMADARSGNVLAAHDAGRVVSIASNAKIVTTSAAMAVLGPTFRFSTAVYADAKKAEDTASTIYVKAGGDPSLSEADLWRLARRVYDAGIRHVTGDVVIDESYFDDEKLPPLFDTRDTDAYYRPAVTAFSLHENAVAVLVRAADHPGEKAIVRVLPHSDYVQIEGSVATEGRRLRSSVRVETEETPDHMVVRVKGKVRAGRTDLWYRKRVPDPGLFAAHAFIGLLRRVGVKVDRGQVRRSRVPEKTRRVASLYSEPLSVLIRKINKKSSNMMAETLLKTLGAEASPDDTPGSWENGVQVVERYLSTVGLKPGDYMYRNGSGLYEATGFSAEQLVSVLRGVYVDFRYQAELMASFPVAGIDGTLRRRFSGSDAAHFVRAKTGTLASVVSLSGYAGGRGTDRTAAFSILITELAVDRIWYARRIADRMAEALVDYLSKNSS